jgi:hypothetical protein
MCIVFKHVITSFTLNIFRAIDILLDIYFHLIALESDNMSIAQNTIFANVQVAKTTYCYKNTKENLLKTDAAIWFSKICKMNQLKPKYVNIKVNGNNRHSVNTKKKGSHQVYPKSRI